MIGRERIILLVLGLAVSAAIVYGAVDRLVLAPGRELASKVEGLAKKNQALDQENAALSRYLRDYANLRDRTFGSSVPSAGVLLNSRVNQLARLAGLGQEDITTNVVNRKVLLGSYSDIVCNINAHGSLERMTNFLYLLSRDRYVHRLTDLSVSPRQGGQEVTFSLGYDTVVLEEIKHKDIAPRAASGPMELARLTDPRRAVYDVIARRNMFAPYVPPPPEVARVERPLTGNGAGGERRPPEAPRSWYDSLVVIGLPSAKGTPEVHVAAPGQDLKQVHKVGDDLIIGKIAMVDYRVLPLPERPGATSSSRVILRIGQDYWAVELGQRLGQRRVLRQQELPEPLRLTLENEQAATQPVAKT